MKKVILTSFASTGRENYNKAQLRLIKSLADLHYIGRNIFRSADGYVDRYRDISIHPGYPVTKKHGLCPDHSQTPYAFKPWLMQEAIENGAEQIVWMDSTIVVNNDFTPLLEYASKHGVCAFDNEGFPLKDWISDIACQRLGITNEDLEGMKQIMACVLIFDITHPVGKAIFEEWLALAVDGGAFQNNGSTRPGFRAHRHDQAVLSALLHKHGVPLLPYGPLAYTDGLSRFKKEEVYFINQGL